MLPAPVPELTAEQRTAECTRLSTEIATLRGEMHEIEELIAGHRTRDQVAGYIAAVAFPPLALGIDQQTSRKKGLDERQQKIDLDLARQRALKCPSS